MMLYWMVIALLGVIHLHAVLLLVPFDVPVFVTIGLVLAIVFFIHRRIIFSISALKPNWHALIFLIQVLIINLYFFIAPSWIYLIPFFLFIAIEIMRFHFSKQVGALTQDIETFASEREQMNETFRVVRAERHDFLKHISSLHYMLENSNETEARSYLDHLVDGYEETNLSIKGERGTVAAILQQMYKRAKNLGIEIVYDLDVPLSLLSLTDQELTSLLGNLLANSIESCEEWQSHRKKQPLITVHFYKRSGLFILVCKNNSLPIPSEVLDHLFVKYGKTTKTGKHEGLGTKIIDDIVKSHDGLLDFVHKNEQFFIKIKIPAIN